MDNYSYGVSGYRLVENSPGLFCNALCRRSYFKCCFPISTRNDEAEMPFPEKDGTMKNTWAIHQLVTTVNFGTKN